MRAWRRASASCGRFCRISGCRRILRIPLQEIRPVGRFDTEIQMEAGFVQGISHMPPATRQIEHIAIFEDAIKDRLPFGHRCIFDIVAQGMKARRAMHLPMFAPGKLQNDHVLGIPMQGEGLLLAPSGIKIGDGKALENILEGLRRCD